MFVDRTAIIGQNEKDAEEELKGIGLVVETVDVAGGEKDIVQDVVPSGGVEPGSVVTLYVYRGDEGGNGDNGNDEGDKGKGNDEGDKGKGNDDKGRG